VCKSHAVLLKEAFDALAALEKDGMLKKSNITSIYCKFCGSTLMEISNLVECENNVYGYRISEYTLYCQDCGAEAKMREEWSW
jgi:ribosomal protein S27E